PEGPSGLDFVLRLIAVLPAAGSSDSLSLVVVDSLDGLSVEMPDAFGQVASRRARIAQLRRVASRRAHLCIVSEEPEGRRRLPEESICETVLRLKRSSTKKGASVIEVVKSRADAHALGSHMFSVLEHGHERTEQRSSVSRVLVQRQLRV